MGPRVARPGPCSPLTDASLEVAENARPGGAVLLAGALGGTLGDSGKLLGDSDGSRTELPTVPTIG